MPFKSSGGIISDKILFAFRIALLSSEFGVDLGASMLDRAKPNVFPINFLLSGHTKILINVGRPFTKITCALQNSWTV